MPFLTSFDQNRPKTDGKQIPYIFRIFFRIFPRGRRLGAALFNEGTEGRGWGEKDGEGAGRRRDDDDDNKGVRALDIQGCMRIIWELGRGKEEDLGRGDEKTDWEELVGGAKNS